MTVRNNTTWVPDPVEYGQLVQKVASLTETVESIHEDFKGMRTELRKMQFLFWALLSTMLGDATGIFSLLKNFM